MRPWWLISLLALAAGGPARATPPPRHNVAELLRTQWRVREEAVQRCSAQARSEGRWGEVIVRFKVRLRGRPTFTTTRSPGITPALEACVRAQAREAVAEPLYGDPAETTLEYEVLLGQPAPLLPPIAELLPVWQAGDRAALGRKLPAEVTASGDGCLLNEPRLHLMQARQRWLNENTRRVSRVWNDLQPRFRRRDDPPFGTAYWISGMLFVIDTGRGLKQALCLSTLDQQRVDSILKDARASIRCLDGGLPQALVDPRLRFPPGRGFHEVGVAQPQICALDRGGRIECCGYAQAGPPPPGNFRTLTLSEYAGCALDELGRAGCWNHAGAELEGRLKVRAVLRAGPPVQPRLRRASGRPPRLLGRVRAAGRAAHRPLPRHRRRAPADLRHRRGR